MSWLWIHETLNPPYIWLLHAESAFSAKYRVANIRSDVRSDGSPTVGITIARARGGYGTEQ